VACSTKKDKIYRQWIFYILFMLGEYQESYLLLHGEARFGQELFNDGLELSIGFLGQFSSSNIIRYKTKSVYSLMAFKTLGWLALRC